MIYIVFKAMREGLDPARNLHVYVSVARSRNVNKQYELRGISYVEILFFDFLLFSTQFIL